jgi:hypothetical protein
MKRTLLSAVIALSALVIAGPAPATSKVSRVTVYGTVGPGATIILKNKAGKRITTLKAGLYSFRINDRSKKDDFHLTGPTVNLHTRVKQTQAASWALTMKKGTYRYYSDAHPKTLKGSFKVT